MKHVLTVVAAALGVGCAAPRSIYKKPQTEAAVLNAYNDRLHDWPVPFESRYVGTSYGVAHVLMSGPASGRPLLLLHALGLGAPMWRDNIAALSRERRVYALDFIGDLGRSRLEEDRHPEDGRAVAGWLAEVLDQLAIGNVDVVGASYGGWAALQLASYRPERVGRLALLGPMGIAPVTAEVASRLLSLVLFPTAEKKREMVRWTLGEKSRARDELEAWMLVAMDCESKLAMPTELTDEALRGIRAPVLLILGGRDGPIGPPERSAERARKLLPMVEVAILPDAGHAMNVDQPDVVNAHLERFLVAASDGRDRD